jgi:ABC-type branched-subunit amino acid transport system substrate-binding protein
MTATLGRRGISRVPVLSPTFVVAFHLSSPLARAAEPVRIGAILPLTGGMAVLGEEEKRGIDRAIERIAAGGDEKVKAPVISGQEVQVST